MASLLTDALPYKNVHLSINLWLAKNGHPVHRIRATLFYWHKSYGALACKPAHITVHNSVDI
jgi:hypothetical protein